MSSKCGSSTTEAREFQARTYGSAFDTPDYGTDEQIAWQFTTGQIRESRGSSSIDRPPPIPTAAINLRDSCPVDI